MTLSLENGLITENGSVVCSKQPDIIDISAADLKNLLHTSKLVSGPDLRIEYCEDGTVIRLYHYNNQWVTATQKCIDASQSFWSSKHSFNDLFWQVFDKSNTSLLDPSFTYVFILLHSQNRLVVKHTRNNLVYLMRIENSSGIQHSDLCGLKNVWLPVRINELDLDSVDSKFWDKKRGVIIKVKSGHSDHSGHSGHSWITYKIDFTNWSLIKDVRGNIPNIQLRYFQLLKDPARLSILTNVYHEHSKAFFDFYNKLIIFIEYIYTLYVDSHIKHTITISPDNKYYKVLKIIHSHYKSTGVSLQLPDIHRKVLDLHPGIIKKILNI
jgi:hypothetical protein